MNQNQNNIDDNETNKITWKGDFITAESFVRAWQQSNSVKALQIEIAQAAKEQGKLQYALDQAQRYLVRASLRLAALKSGDVECDALVSKDVCAINKTVYESYSFAVDEIPSLTARIEDAECDSRQYTRELTKAQELQDCPELADLSDGVWWADIPSANSCQSRAARYRAKGVKLKKLPYRVGGQQGDSRMSWEALAELADELVAGN
jgi:hypothetical protein